MEPCKTKCLCGSLGITTLGSPVDPVACCLLTLVAASWQMYWLTALKLQPQPSQKQTVLSHAIDTLHHALSGAVWQAHDRFKVCVNADIVMIGKRFVSYHYCQLANLLRHQQIHKRLTVRAPQH